MIFTVLFPFLLLIWVIIVVVVQGVIYPKGPQILKDKIMSVTVITFWILQPDVARELFKAFTCVKNNGFSDEEPSRLYHDLEIICW